MLTYKSPGSKATHTHFIQTKLKIGKPGDKYEREADVVANRVMQMSDSDTMQMQPMEEEEARPKLMMQTLEKGTGILQTNSNQDNSSRLDSISSQLENKNKGSSLPKSTNRFMSNAIGNDFSRIKIHTGSRSIRMNQQLGARAFTFGNDIYFNRGEYKPFVSEGKKLLAHELTHVVQQTKPIIQRVKRPATSKVTNLTSYTAGTRQSIKYNAAFNLQSSIAQYFVQNIAMSVRSKYNLNYVVKGFPSTEKWVENPMKALALYSFRLDSSATESPIINQTTVQHLDLTSQKKPNDKKKHGPNANIRLTSTLFKSSGKGKSLVENVQLLIEKLSNHKASKSTETAKARRNRFATNYQIYNTRPYDPINFTPKLLTDKQYDMILEAMNELPVKILKSIKGIPIHGSTTNLGTRNETGEYKNNRAAGSKTWTRKITIYEDFFKMNPDQRKFLMVHELGHAVDFRPNEKINGSGKTSKNKSKEFKKAVKLDGKLAKGVSTYSKTSEIYSEYYAEAFSMYFNQPDTLKALRPNVYKYFKTKYP